MCGAFAGGLGQFLASPADLVKVNIQMEGKRKLEGLPARYSNDWIFILFYISHAIHCGLLIPDRQLAIVQ